MRKIVNKAFGRLFRVLKVSGNQFQAIQFLDAVMKLSICIYWKLFNSKVLYTARCEGLARGIVIFWVVVVVFKLGIAF